jgi:hypothetical protein
MRELHLGMTGPDVSQWERFLVAREVLARPGTGTFDAETRSATQAYQRAASIEPTGRADAPTLARAVADGLLDAALEELPPPRPPAAKRVDLTVLIPVLVAVVGGLFTAGVAILNARNTAQNTLAAEREKLRSSIILAAIRTEDTAQSLANLKFFADLGFIELDADRLARFERDPAAIPVLPVETPRLLSSAERDALLEGTGFTVTESGSSTVSLDEGWQAENIITVDVPQLRGVPTVGGEPFSGRLRFHRVAAPALLAAFEEIERLGLLGDIQSFGGAFAPRVVRGSVSRLSAHALGIAIDINVAANPFGQPPAPEGTPGSVLRLVPVFERHGFVWGGRSSRDPMHFEYADRAVLFGAN